MVTRLCCPECFDDRGLREDIFPTLTPQTGICAFCGSENVPLVESKQLQIWFELLVNVYQPDERGTRSAQKKETGGGAANPMSFSTVSTQSGYSPSSSSLFEIIRRTFPLSIVPAIGRNASSAASKSARRLAVSQWFQNTRAMKCVDNV